MENGNEDSPKTLPTTSSGTNRTALPCGGNANFISTHSITVGTQCSPNKANVACTERNSKSAAVPEKNLPAEGTICNEAFLNQPCGSIRHRTQTWPGVPHQTPVYSRQSSTASNCATQTDPPPSTGSVCLSVATAPVLAQECTSDNVTVTVPPIRSELIMPPANWQTTETSQLNQLESVVCPRPADGPEQPPPDLIKLCAPPRIYSAHYNLPKVIPIQNGPLLPAAATEPNQVRCDQSDSAKSPSNGPISSVAATAQPSVNGSFVSSPRYPISQNTSPSSSVPLDGNGSSPKKSQQSPVSNLPPRPPATKKTGCSTSPVPQVVTERRPSLSSQGSASKPTSPQGTPNKPPQAFVPSSQPISAPFMGRRPSQTSQGSPSGTQGPAPTATSKVPPLPPFPMGRFPSQLSSPASPSGYPGNTTSPFSSPIRHQESPSNSRPPSWYSYRSPLRGRDSSPSATSRDSLDSYIRSPPSGIYSTRLSQGNLLASRSSMDNLSVSSGDSVFDDIVSESEKKSLDEANESFGSVGSIPMVDAEASGRGAPQRECAEVSPEDADQQVVPGRGRGVATVKQDSFDMATPMDPPPPTQVGPPVGQLDYPGAGAAALPAPEAELPPSYEEAVGLIPEGASPTHLLTYKDFVPTFAATRRKWESFEANEWLVYNPEVRVAACESILGFSAQSHGFNPDRVVGTRSKICSESTFFIRFLRIWYSRLGQASGDVEPARIRYANFVSPTDCATITTLVDLINSKLNKVIKGDLMNVETLHILRKAVRCPDTSCWIERPQDPKSYSFFLRVFWLDNHNPVQHNITLGYMDCVPQYAHGKNYPNDYEPFSCLMRIAQWWSTHTAEPGAHIINCQSLYVKRKASGNFWQRLHFTEAGASNTFLSYTYYNQLLRIYYQTPTSACGIPLSPSVQISYKTFMPVQLTSPTDLALKFERFGETFNRVLHWLRCAGAQLLSMETVPVRMYGGLQGAHGAESTLVRCEGRTYSDHEHWLHCIRVYLYGEYQEPDSSRMPPVPPVTPYFTCTPRSIALLPATIAF